MTQQDSTQRPQIYLIGRCKDMMSKMDPMRALGMQDEVAGTSLVTPKFSSSIFCWKGLYKFQEGESKNTKDRPWSLLAKVSPLPFIATRGLTEGEPVTKQCTFHGRIHGSVHGGSCRCSQRRNNEDSPNSNILREY